MVSTGHYCHYCDIILTLSGYDMRGVALSRRHRRAQDAENRTMGKYQPIAHYNWQ